MAVETFPRRLTIRQLQYEQLRTLLAAVANNPFYRAKFSAAEAPNRISRIADFSERFPFTTKQEILADQSLHPPYGTNLAFPLKRYTRCHQTSGTAGIPLRWLDTPESWAWMLDNWSAIFAASEITSSDRVFFAFSFGPFLGFWTAFEAALRLGCACFPGGGMSSVARARAIFDHQISVLCGTPTYCLHLGEIAQSERLCSNGGPVKTLIVAGEAGGGVTATRARLSVLWSGARVLDHHGMTEIGPVSYTCRARPGILHVLESSYFPEVIDPQTTQPVQPGEMGELILTNLGRLGSPLLRYRTGDLVRTGLDSVCECGSSDLSLVGGILSRLDDMVVVRGVNVYPSAIEEIVFGTGTVAEYQVTVDSTSALTELRLQVEPVATLGDDTRNLAERVQALLQTALALRVPVTLVPVGSLPRAEMKARRWLRIPISDNNRPGCKSLLE